MIVKIFQYFSRLRGHNGVVFPLIDRYVCAGKNCKIYSFFSFSFRAAATGAAYPPGQTGYAVAPAAAATYTTPRPGYDPTYHQAPASQGTYASELNHTFSSCVCVLSL